MQKFSQFYVLYQNIVQFDHSSWKLDYFEKSVLELMADQVHASKEKHIAETSSLIMTSLESRHPI